MGRSVGVAVAVTGELLFSADWCLRGQCCHHLQFLEIALSFVYNSIYGSVFSKIIYCPGPCVV